MRQNSACGHLLVPHQNSQSLLLPQNTQADFPIAVEVGVKPHCVISRCHQFDPWWVDGIIWRTAKQEQEETPFIRRVKWACDQCMNLENKSPSCAPLQNRAAPSTPSAATATNLHPGSSTQAPPSARRARPSLLPSQPAPPLRTPLPSATLQAQSRFPARGLAGVHNSCLPYSSTQSKPD